MAQSDSNAEKEPKLILRGVTKLADDSFDTTVLLYQGKGDYLQGFVKVDGVKHQVLAFMNERKPDHQPAKSSQTSSRFQSQANQALMMIQNGTKSATAMP